MFQHISKFQIILMLVFGVFIVIGVILFSIGGRGNTTTGGNVVAWGTMRAPAFNAVLENSGLNDNDAFSITYVEKSEETFDQQLIEALAADKGPDLVFLSQDAILRHQDKLLPIPFQTYTERDFKDVFIEEGELFLIPQGILAFPFIIDPMVMYWNRDTFTNSALVSPPRYWSEFYNLANRLTVKDSNLIITKSAVALGEYSNITHATELLSLLIMQAGSPITIRDGIKIKNVLNEKFGYPVMPSDRAVTFFTEFSNPVKSFYSWNRSFPESKNMFLAGDLAVYFGFASELADIRAKNPNLNFDVASIPQIQGTERKMTFGKMIGIGILRSSKNASSAYQAAVSLTNTAAISSLASVSNLPPVRRDLLAVTPGEAYKQVFYESAIQSKAWLSPRLKTVGPVFRELVESITGGREFPSAALSKANSALNALLGI